MDGYFLDLGELTDGSVVLRGEDPTRGPGWHLYRDPAAILCARSPEEVAGCLRRAAEHAKTGWAAGFLTYEAAAGLAPHFSVLVPDWDVVAWFALFDSPPAVFRELRPTYRAVSLGELRADWDFPAYRRAFYGVKQALAEGESYQVNLTFRQRFRLEGSSAADFFASRCGVDPPPFAAFVQGHQWSIASLSPERLFERRGSDVESTPMKGTAPVGKTRAESAAAAQAMSNDPKSMAENLMVVDMVRSDLGAVCTTGSVHTPRLLSVERHRNLLQMVSSVRGRCDAPADTLLRAVFPAASVTGAPRVSTMRLIRELEGSPRHVYCGAIGVMSPGGERFSVAIRTALFRGQEGEFGVGSGVVWDSEPEAEYEEALAKRDRLMQSAPAWELVEAMSTQDLPHPGALSRHLDRLEGQAMAFAIPFDREALRSALTGFPSAEAGPRAKVRIGLRQDGEIGVTVGPSAIASQEITAVLATRPVASEDPNLRIKTSSRAVLDGHLDEHPEADEVLLFNENGLITEFCRGNLAARIEGDLISPRPEIGCLAGLGVAELVRQGRVRYADIPVAALARAEEVWFVNSVTGMVRVRMRAPGGEKLHFGDVNG